MGHFAQSCGENAMCTRIMMVLEKAPSKCLADGHLEGVP